MGVVNDSKKPFSFCVSGGSGSHPDCEQERVNMQRMMRSCCSRLVGGQWMNRNGSESDELEKNSDLQ